MAPVRILWRVRYVDNKTTFPSVHFASNVFKHTKLENEWALYSTSSFQSGKIMENTGEHSRKLKLGIYM